MKAIQNKEGLICLEMETTGESIITALSPEALGIKEVIEREIEALSPEKIAKVQKLEYLPFALSDYAKDILALANSESYIYGDCNGNRAVWSNNGQVFVILNNNSKPVNQETQPEKIKPTEVIISPTKLSDYTKQITILKNSIGRSFLEIGRLLYEVREEKVYQQKYKTFSEYLTLVFPQSRATAYALIQVYESKLEPEICFEIGWAKARELASLDTVIDLPTEDKKEVIEEISKPEVSLTETKAIVSRVKKIKDKPVKETILEAKEEVKEIKETKKVTKLDDVLAKIKPKGKTLDIEKTEPEPIDVLGIETFEQERIVQLKTEIIAQVQKALTVEDIDYIGGLLMDLRDFFENTKN